MHHFPQSGFGYVLVQLGIEFAQPFCSPPYLCSLKAGQRTRRVSADVLTQHGLFHAVLIVSFPCGGCTEVADEAVPRNSSFAHVGRTHRVLAGVPPIVSSGHHEGAVDGVLILRRRFEQPTTKGEQAVEREARGAPAAVEGDGEYCTEQSTEQKGQAVDHQHGLDCRYEKADAQLGQQILGDHCEVDGGRRKTLCSQARSRAMPILAPTGHIDA